MKTFEINYSKNTEPIYINYFPNKDREKLIILIGGSGDDKDKFNEVVHKLVKKGIKESVLEFSFRGYESEKYQPLKQQIKDLVEVLDYVIENYNFEEIYLVCTSSGAVSTSYALANPRYSRLLNKAIFLDPADHLMKELETYDEAYVWNGASDYNPVEEVVSDQINRIKGKVLVYIVRFSIRNSKGNEYADDRGKDYHNLFPRLNAKMVKTFYDKIPTKNRGEYIEVNDLPHAFMRDGNVDQNFDKVADLIIHFLDK